MKKQLCVIEGDGIGPEVTRAAVQVLQAVLPDVDLQMAEAGWNVFQATGQSVPDSTLTALESCGAGLFGAVSSPSYPVDGYQSAILRIRQQLSLHANIRPVDSRWMTPTGDSPKHVRLVIVRENTEGLYVGQETSTEQGAVAQRVVTRSASFRIGQLACDVADAFGFEQITVVHKANVLPISDGLFRDCVLEEIDRGVVDYDVRQALVDIVAYQLVAQPESFQTIVTTNMFGDILSDLAAHWCGGMGRAPSLNLGSGIAIAEPVHGSAPDIAGQGIADPTAAILSVALLCRLHWNEPEVADQIENGLCSAIQNQQRDHDRFETQAFIHRVIDAMGNSIQNIPN